MTAASSSDEFTRRSFLRMGGLGVIGLSTAEAGVKGPWPRRCIFLLMAGGPSQLESFDPKPHAPLEIRGPFRPISTSVPGVYFSETLPLLAQRADRLTVVRSLSHDAAPVHETGLQLLQTGRLAQRDFVPPGIGAIVARTLGGFNGEPAHLVTPRPLTASGTFWLGQGAGCLGPEFEPVPAPARLPIDDEPEPVRRAYGETLFGRACLHARRLSIQGVRLVTVNLQNDPGEASWDCHAHVSAPTRLIDYRHTVCADFDRALSALLDDLEQSGMLAETLVVAAGEFGRTPKVNANGGRDHWPGVWSAVLAGAGMPAGRIIGASDAKAASPADVPLHPGSLVATILQSLGVESGRVLEGTGRTCCDHAPIAGESGRGTRPWSANAMISGEAVEGPRVRVPHECSSGD